MSAVSTSPSFRPLYEQIKILLTQSLIAGEWKPGDAIPSEIDLASRYGVSQGTVRKAIDDLALENILVRRQGKGTFVATYQEPTTQYRFLRIKPNDGSTHKPVSTFLDVRRTKASSEVSRALQLKVGAPIVAIRRLLSFADRPLILDEMQLSGTEFATLTLARIREFKGSMYSFYEGAYGVRMIRAEERIRAVGAEPDVAAHLRIEPGSPLLCVDRIAFTYGDRPVEFRRGLALTDGYSYVNELV
jgi:GntR family transcriptional regulator